MYKKELNEDQVKILAKKFANKQTYPLCMDLDVILVNFYKYLSTRYCIVKREKVIGEYYNSKKAFDLNKGNEDWSEGYWNGRTDAIDNLFDTSIFN